MAFVSTNLVNSFIVPLGISAQIRLSVCSLTHLLMVSRESYGSLTKLSRWMPAP